jgi:hypothetical protein
MFLVSTSSMPQLFRDVRATDKCRVYWETSRINEQCNRAASTDLSALYAHTWENIPLLLHVPIRRSHPKRSDLPRIPKGGDVRGIVARFPRWPQVISSTASNVTTLCLENHLFTLRDKYLNHGDLSLWGFGVEHSLYSL